MTLEEKAEKWIDKNISLGMSMYNPSIESTSRRAYLAGAKELEKQNRLLGERCNQLLKDKGALTDRLDQLQEQNSQMFNTIALQEQQIEKMKCCENCKNQLSLAYGEFSCDLYGDCKHHSKWELKE